MLSYSRYKRRLIAPALTAAVLGVPSLALAHVSFTAPPNYSELKPGQQVVLKWGIEDHGPASFSIEFAEDIGKPWTTVATPPKQGGGPFEYTWTVPNVSCAHCRLRITMTAAGSGQQWDGSRQLSIGATGTLHPTTGESTPQSASAPSEDGADGGCSLTHQRASWPASTLMVLGLAAALRRRGRR